MRNVFFFVIFIFSCVNSKDKCDSLKNNINYDEILYAVRKKVIDLTWIEEPLTYPEFYKLANYSECFRENAISLIKLSKNDKTLLGLSILSMKELNSEETILFANDIIDFIDEENLLLWLYGAYGNKNFINNFNKKNYIEFFNLCINKFPKSKGKIMYLINGNLNI